MTGAEFLDKMNDQQRAAYVDGASHFQAYRYIALPLSGNVLVTLAILTFMRTWGNFIWPLVVAPKPELYTVSQMVGLFNAPFSHTTVDVVMTANLLAALPPPGDEVRCFEDGEVLGHRLAGHIQAAAQLAQGLAVLHVQPIQQLPAARIGQRTKDRIIVHGNRQLLSCLLIGN